MVETKGFVIHDFKENSEILKNKLIVNEISRNQIQIGLKKKIRETLKITIPIRKTKTSTITCTFNNEISLELNFENNEKKFLFFSIDNIASAVSSVEIITILAQTKFNYAYFLIDFLNLNRIIYYLFLVDFFKAGVIKSANDFSRSANYQNLNNIVFLMFGLKDKRKLTKFKIMNLMASLAINENMIKENDIINIKQILIAFIMSYLLLSYFYFGEYFKRIYFYAQKTKLTSKIKKK
jgi:hypothetical protein